MLCVKTVYGKPYFCISKLSGGDGAPHNKGLGWFFHAKSCLWRFGKESFICGNFLIKTAEIPRVIISDE